MITHPLGRPDPVPDRRGLWAVAGAVLSAALSSVCCWLPLLLLAFGTSSAGVSTLFEGYRWPLLGLAGVLLGSGFYFTYFRRPRCAPGAACAAGSTGLRRFQRGMLWFSTLLVLCFAVFPNAVVVLLGDGTPPSALEENSGPTSRPLEHSPALLELGIEGMTCPACATTLAADLKKIPEVHRVSVSYDSKRASLELADRGKLSVVLDAIAAHGYRAVLQERKNDGKHEKH